jgi:hypothetical protein
MCRYQCTMGSLKKLQLADSLSRTIRDRRRRGVLGHKERNQLELFITGSLRQLIPDDHVLVRVDRVLDLSGSAVRWLTATVATMVVPVSILRLRSG